MKPRDVFSIIVATIGMIVVCVGVTGLISATVTFVATSPSYGNSFGRNSFGYLAGIAAIEIVFGFLIMKGYPPFVDIAFPSEGPTLMSQKREDVELKTGPVCVSCGKHMPAGSKLCPSCGWTQPE